MHERIDAILRLGMIVLFAALPWFFVPVSWIAVGESKLYFLGGLTMLAVVAWVYARIRERGVTIVLSPVYAAAIGVCVAYAISAALSGFQSISLVGSGSDTDTLAFVLLQTGLLIFIGSLFSGHPGVVNRALRALFLGGFIALFLQAIHFAFPHAMTSVFSGTTSNVFGNWHEFALFAGLLLFMSVAFYHSPMLRGRWQLLGWGIGMLASTILIIANYADVWKFVAGSLFVLILVRAYRAEKRHAHFWRTQIPTLLLAFLALGGVFFGGSVASHLPSAFQISLANIRPSLTGTLQIGQSSLTQPKTFVFGTGPNTFTREWGRYKPVGINETPFWDVDFPTGVAAYPTAFITVGFFGLVALLAFGVALVIMIVQFLRSRTSSPVAALAVPLGLTTLYLLALQLFAVPGSLLTILLFVSAGLLVALLAPAYVRERHIGITVSTRSGIAALGSLGVFAILCVVPAAAMVRAIASNDLLNRAIATYNAGGDIATANAYVQDALMVHPQNDAAQRAAVQFGLMTLQQLADTDASQDAARAQLTATLAETIKHGLAAVSIDGDSYQNWLLLASIYGQLAGSNVDGAYDNARIAYKKALASQPNSPVPYVSLAQLEMLQGHDALALSYLQQAVQLKPDFAEAYFLASQIYAHANNPESALRAAEAAAHYEPDNSNAWYNVGVIAYAGKQYPEAAAAFKQALTLQPKYANALYLLGLTYYAQGNAADALATFQALQEIDPNQPTIERIIEKLSAGEAIAPSDIDPNTATSTPPVKKVKKKKH